MPLSINTNLASLGAQRALNSSQAQHQTAVQRLSTGLRINSAKDDSAGLAIATKMTSQVRGQQVAIRNANDAISLSQTAEGALGSIGNTLQRMRELAVQSSNGTNDTDARAAMQSEFAELQSEIGRTVDATDFNGTKVLKIGTTTGIDFQVGAGQASSDASNKINLKATDLSGATSEVKKSLDVATVKISGATAVDADKAIAQIDKAISEVTSTRSTFGAAQNRFSSAISNLEVSVESQTAARSRIMDTDFAQETANMSRADVLQQAGMAMLTQANSSPNNVLQLLRG